MPCCTVVQLNSLDLAKVHQNWQQPSWLTTEMIDMVRIVKDTGNSVAHLGYKDKDAFRKALAESDDETEDELLKDEITNRLESLYASNNLAFGEAPK